jgi:hypothetical protein
MGEREFVLATQQALWPLGFTRESTLACVATCRDEISQSKFEHVRETWGHSFNLAGLAGIPFAGKTGFGAALAHGPQLDGRERYVFYAGPHIGIGSNGEPGVAEREGRQAPSTACGALLGLLGELREDRLGPVDDVDDVEQGMIRRNVGGSYASLGAAVPDLFELTRRTHDVILDDIRRILASTIDPAKADHAVITGVQIHGPGMTNYIQPRTMYAVVNGASLPLALTPAEVR